MNMALTLRGETIQAAPPPGTIAVAGPYRPGTEDWMLFRAVGDLRRVGIEVLFVRERAPEIQGGFVGVAIYRRGVHAIIEDEEHAEGEGEAQVADPVGPAPEGQPGSPSDDPRLPPPRPHKRKGRVKSRN